MNYSTSDHVNSIKYPREATIFAACCASVFCIVGIVGNFVTILALIKCPKLRGHATTAFILSLCVSDLIFCTLNLPLTAARFVYEQWIFGEVLCKLFPVFFYGNVAVSVLNMVAITLNRYVLISYHQYYSQFYSKTSIWIQLISIWSFAFLLMLPPLLGVWGTLGLHPPTFSCTILDKDGISPKKFVFLLGFFLPCIVIIIAYSCIYYSVRKSRKKISAHQPITGRRTTRRDKDDSRLTKLMVIIFGCFLLCFLPLMLVNVLDGHDIKYPILHVMASVFAWASSVVNPFIYAASNKQYRTAYTKLFRKVKSSAMFSDSKQGSNNSKVDNKNGSVTYKPSI